MKTTKKNILGILGICFFAGIVLADPSNYKSGQGTANEATAYAQVKEICLNYLSNRDSLPWLQKIQGKDALDYGSGLGYSADYLSKQGFKVTGVDMSPHMVEKAKAAYPDLEFVLSEKNKIPLPNNSFDLVYSRWVLFEIESLAAIKEYLHEGMRVLKNNGTFIAITGSTHLTSDYQSVLLDTSFSENAKPKSGSTIRVTAKEINVTFTDYYWTEEDYRTAFNEVGLKIQAVEYPLGKDGEGYDWRNEKTKGPIVLIVATKAKS